MSYDYSSAAYQKHGCQRGEDAAAVSALDEGRHDGPVCRSDTRCQRMKPRHRQFAPRSIFAFEITAEQLTLIVPPASVLQLLQWQTSSNDHWIFIWRGCEIRCPSIIAHLFPYPSWI